MRRVINISLPEQTVREVKLAVKKGNYVSTSEFFRDLLRDWRAGELLQELNHSREEIKEGKGLTLKSLKDLR